MKVVVLFLLWAVLFCLWAALLQWLWTATGAGEWTHLGEMPYPIAALVAYLTKTTPQLQVKLR